MPEPFHQIPPVFTLPETTSNIAPRKWMLGRCTVSPFWGPGLFWKGLLLLVSGSVPQQAHDLPFLGPRPSTATSPRMPGSCPCASCADSAYALQQSPGTPWRKVTHGKCHCHNVRLGSLVVKNLQYKTQINEIHWNSAMFYLSDMYHYLFLTLLL